MFSIIAGNLCSALGTAADAFSASRKTPKGVLYMQSLGQLLYGISTLFLGGYSASAQNLVSILRNLAAAKKLEHKALPWVFPVLAVGLGLLCNNLGLIGLLPILANLEYTLAVFRFKDDERKLKIAYLVCIALFMVFNTMILNLVGAAMNLLIFCTTFAFVLKTKPGKTEAV